MVDGVSTVATRQNIFHWDELLLQKRGAHGAAAASGLL